MSSVTHDPSVPANNATVPPPTEPAPQHGVGKSKEEIYLELAKLCQQSFQNRQSYEWKIAFGLWTAIGTITFFATKHAGAISGWRCWVLGLAYFLVGAVWTAIWQPFLHSANRRDKKWKHYYMHRAENRAEKKVEADPEPDEPNILWWWQQTEQREHWPELRTAPAWVQIAVTWVILVVSFLIILPTSNGAPVPGGTDVISVSGDNATKVVDKLTK
jgi:hypothetical protein